MGWWFGRKGAPADARAFVPGWASIGLSGDSAGEGFARSYQAQFDEVFRRNPVGQRAVRLVAGMLGGLTIDAIERDARAASHNEALQILDLVVAGAVEEPPRAAPPSTPVEGACYIVDAAASGDWAGRVGELAGWTSGGWRFVAPIEGMAVRVRSTGAQMSFTGGAWQTGAAIAAPSGGTTVDAQARAAIGAILDALRAAGLIAA